MKTPTNCPICEKGLTRVRGPHQIEVGKRRVTVEDDYLHCASCKEDIYLPGQVNELQRRVADQIRREEDLLTPEEIRAIREGLDLSQADFETLLGVGPKTVVRWEKGTVFQNKGTDNLMRVVRDVPEAAMYLSDRQRVPIATELNALGVSFALHEPYTLYRHGTVVAANHLLTTSPSVHCGPEKGPTYLSGAFTQMRPYSTAPEDACVTLH